MRDNLDILRADLLDRITGAAKPSTLADKIGRYALGTVMYLDRHHRLKLADGRKVWESKPTLLYDNTVNQHDSTEWGRHVLVLATGRQRRQPPLPGCTIELVQNYNYSNPLAYIKTPDENNSGVVIVEGEANNDRDLVQLWPIIKEMAGSRVIYLSHVAADIARTQQTTE